MKAILNECGANCLFSFEELESASKILHSETVGKTKSQIFFKRFCLSHVEDNEHHLHHIFYYALDAGGLNTSGDVDGDLVAVEYELL